LYNGGQYGNIAILLMLSKERGKEYARDEIMKEIGWPEDQEPDLERIENLEQ